MFSFGSPFHSFREKKKFYCIPEKLTPLEKSPVDYTNVHDDLLCPH